MNKAAFLENTPEYDIQCKIRVYRETGESFLDKSEESVKKATKHRFNMNRLVEAITALGTTLDTIDDRDFEHPLWILKCSYENNATLLDIRNREAEEFKKKADEAFVKVAVYTKALDKLIDV